jgi:hypothetical protein
LGPISFTVYCSQWTCVADQVLGNLEGKIGRRYGVMGPARSANPSLLGLDLGLGFGLVSRAWSGGFKQ